MHGALMRFGGTTVRIDDRTRTVTTRYDDGTEVISAGHHCQPWAVGRAHDLLHTRLAYTLGLPHSPTLWALAHGSPVDPDVAEAEEAMVLAAQHFIALTKR